MDTVNSVLVVDDDPAFLEATAELLRRDGYSCDCASDTSDAVDKLNANRYDALVSDIRMPNNPDLRIVREAAHVAEGMPVILVTAYPTVDSAIGAIELPVVAYLQKPLDHEELRRHLHNSITHTQGYRKVSRVRELLEKCVHDLQDMETACRLPDGMNRHAGAVLPPQTIRALSECLTELVNLETEAISSKAQVKLCELLECPQWRIHRSALADAVSVLKETRKRFKSRELAELRDRLESHLEFSKDTA